MKLSFLLVLFLTAFGFLLPAAVSAQPSGPSAYVKVPLDKPAELELKPLVDGPLLRGQPYQFGIELDGAPKPINMWSCRIEYTSPTLHYESLYAPGREKEVAVVISDPYVLEDGWECRSISGVSLNGWTGGEILRLNFTVPDGAPEMGTIRLAAHPQVKEGLAYDSESDRKTYDYERVFKSDKTTDMKVEDVPPGGAGYVIPTPTPRVLFSRKKD